MVAVSDDGSRGIVIGRALPSIGARMYAEDLPPLVPGRRPVAGEPICTFTAVATEFALPEDENEAEVMTGDPLASSTSARRTLTVIDLPRWKALSSLVLPSLGISRPITFTVPAVSDPAVHEATVVLESDVLWDSFGRRHATMSGRVGSTVSATFSRDGRRVATWTWDHVIRVWSTESGKAKAALTGHRDGITQVVFSPDGSRVASASHDGTVRLWPLASPAAATVLSSHESSVLAVGFSPDGRQIVAGGADGRARVWDIGGKELARLEGHQDAVVAVAFSPDGARVATGSSDRTVRLWESTTGRLEDTLRGHTGEVASVAFSPDGRTVVSGSADQTVRLWDAAHLASGRAPFVGALALRLMRWSPNPVRLFGDYLGGGLQQWNPEKPQQTQRWAPPVLSEAPPSSNWDPEPITGALDPSRSRLASSADGSRAVTAYGNGAVVLWRLTDRTVPTVLQDRSGDGTNVVAISADGSLVAAAFRSEIVRVWDAASGHVLATWRSPSDVSGLSFSPDLRALAVGAGRTVTLWDRSRGVPMREFVGDESSLVLETFSLSPDGRMLACGHRNGTVRLWNVADGTQAGVLRGDSERIASLAFDPAGSRLAAASLDGIVRVWDVTARELLLVFRGKPRAIPNYGSPWEVSFDGDGRRLLAAGLDSVVHLFDSRTAYPAAAVEAVEAAAQSDPLLASIVRRLSDDRALSAETRQLAVAIAQARGEDADTLNDRGWSIASRAGRDAASYERAVGYAEAAVAMVPFKGPFVDTLAVALYRAGRYQESLTALTRAVTLRGKPGGLHLVFMAMCQQRLGATEQARASLEQYRKRPPRWYDHTAEERAGWLREAEALIAGGAAKAAASPR
jgi:WD40 repeat protein